MVNLPDGRRIGMQDAIDQVYLSLIRNHLDSRRLWDLALVKKWGKAPATAKQLQIIKTRCKGFDATGLSKGDANQILNRLFNDPRKRGRRL